MLLHLKMKAKKIQALLLHEFKIEYKAEEATYKINEV